MAKIITATGRRKSAVAQVKMTSGTGKITINGKDVREFMPHETYVMDLMQPLVATNNEKTFDIEVKVTGDDVKLTYTPKVKKVKVKITAK